MTCSRAGRASMARPAKPACSVTPRSRSSRAPAQAPREASGAAQPQPASPAAFACSSATQQPADSALAGPPQHPSVSDGPEQTPVSGSTSCTRSAASMSPAMAAATERACS